MARRAHPGANFLTSRAGPGRNPVLSNQEKRNADIERIRALRENGLGLEEAKHILKKEKLTDAINGAHSIDALKMILTDIVEML